MSITATKLNRKDENGEDQYFIEVTKTVQRFGGEDFETKNQTVFSREKLEREKADLQARIVDINVTLAAIDK